MPHASFVIALRLNLTQPKPSNHCDHLPLKFSDNSTSKLKFKIGVQTPMLPLLSIIPSFIRIILKILEHKFSLRMTMEQIKYTSKSFAAHHTNRWVVVDLSRRSEEHPWIIHAYIGKIPW
nr:hypothetical protein CFP56_24835 [Quercus suber]